MKHKLLAVFVTLLLLMSHEKSEGQSSAKMPLDFCDLVSGGDSFDGKEVTVRATYRYGYEWQEIYCTGCRDASRVWLEIDEETVGETSLKLLKRLPKNNGTVNAIFTGRFEKSGGPFGDGGYRFRLKLVAITDTVLVTKSGAAPEQLHKTLRFKVCSARSTSAAGQNCRP